MEKPPQNNALLMQNSFTYHIICASVPVQLPANIATAYATNLEANLHELRLTFLWPQLPNGQLPPQPPHQTYRTMIAGRSSPTWMRGRFYIFSSRNISHAP